MNHKKLASILNVVVTGSEGADGMCQNNNESNIQLILHNNLFI